MDPTAELVGDPQAGKRYVVVTQRTDFRPIPTPTFHGVARFTEEKYSPSKTRNILLRTPTYYRKSEDGNHMDAAQAGEWEYRFAVLAGRHTTDTFRLDVTPELCRLTTPWRFGDTWWSS